MLIDRHTPLSGEGFRTMMPFQDEIYLCSPEQIAWLDADFQLHTFPYELAHLPPEGKAILELLPSDQRLIGITAYAEAFELTKTALIDMKEVILNCLPGGFTIIQRGEDYVLMKEGEEVLHFGPYYPFQYTMQDDIGVFALRMGRREDEILCYDFAKKKENWRVKLELEDNRIRQFLDVINGNIYASCYDNQIKKISLVNGKEDKAYAQKMASMIESFPIGKVDKGWFVHPSLELHFESGRIYQRKLEMGLLASGNPKLEVFFEGLDYIFDDDYLYFQIHAYPHPHSDDLVTNILKWKRMTDEIEERYYTDPTEPIFDAKKLLFFQGDMLILTARGKLVRLKMGVQG